MEEKYQKMIEEAEKFKALITFENCLEDWIVVNWAEEIKDE